MLSKLINEQMVKTDIKTCWDFFSNPSNLKLITPDDMFISMDIDKNFQMYPGMIISYKIKPLAGIKMNWVTEITKMEQYKFFIDEQRFGPYKFWHHQHFFEEKKEGILIKDIVNYLLPFSFLGSIADKFIVRQKLKNIFDYRNYKIAEVFG